ncbi:helix-turn-helix domain-containing protein [Clostridioides sp. ES-S-0108-01]
MLNVSRQAISKWESNKTYPDIEICKYEYNMIS